MEALFISFSKASVLKLVNECLRKLLAMTIAICKESYPPLD